MRLFPISSNSDRAFLGHNPEKSQAPLYLNVYDLTPVNNYLYWFGCGVFHSGIEAEPMQSILVFYSWEMMCMEELRTCAYHCFSQKNPSIYHIHLPELVARLERPCLYALVLGFVHPNTKANLSFFQIPPTDFTNILHGLRNIGTEKVTSLLRDGSVSETLCRYHQ